MYLFGRAVQNGSRASTYTSRETANAGAAIAEWGRLFLAMEIVGADTCVAAARCVALADAASVCAVNGGRLGRRVPAAYLGVHGTPMCHSGCADGVGAVPAIDWS